MSEARTDNAQTFFDSYGQNEWFGLENGMVLTAAALGVALPATSFGIYGALVPLVGFAASVVAGLALGTGAYLIKIKQRGGNGTGGQINPRPVRWNRVRLVDRPA